MRRAWLPFALLLSLAACTRHAEPFRVEQRHEAPIPGMAGLKVSLSDIGVSGVKNVEIKDAAGKTLAEGGPLDKGARLPFQQGGKKYVLVVDKVDYHFTDTDYAFFYVEPEK